jgi:uncharacterized protein (DUF2141 family)
MKTLLIAFVLFFANQSISQEVSFRFEISNLRTTDGSIIVSVYKDAESFDEGKPWMHKTISKKENMDSGSFKAQFLLPPGEYGLVFVDDENNDGEMSNNFVGIPKEGFGFSNFYLTGFKKPKFPDFSFSLSGNMEQMQVRLRYL